MLKDRLSYFCVKKNTMPKLLPPPKHMFWESVYLVTLAIPHGTIVSHVPGALGDALQSSSSSLKVEN